MKALQGKKPAQMPQMPTPPTEEELAKQRERALKQKLMALAESAFLAMASNPALVDKDPKELLERAMLHAEAWMSEFYGLVRKPKEEETPKEEAK